METQTCTNFAALYASYMQSLWVFLFCWTVCVLSDLPEWLLRFGFYKSQLKTALINLCKLYSIYSKAQYKSYSVGWSAHTNLSGGNTGSGDVWWDLSDVNKKWAESCITRCRSFNDWCILSWINTFHITMQ